MKFLIFFLIFIQISLSNAKKIKLQPLIVIQINHLLDLSVKQFYKETLASQSQFTGHSVKKIQAVTKLLLNSAKSLPPETALHYKKIFQSLDVQLSLLLKSKKMIYAKQAWKSLFIISRSFNVKTYFYGFCYKDKSMWLQAKNTKPLNPLGVKSCINAI